MTEAAEPIQPLDLGGQIVFLAGPPGSGKTSLGSRVCQELGLRFASLPDGTSDFEVARSRIPKNSGRSRRRCPACNRPNSWEFGYFRSECATSKTPDLGRAAMQAVIRQRSADVVELPWTLQLAEGVFREARQAGRLIGLWTHPVDMQARSGRSEPFITPGEN